MSKEIVALFSSTEGVELAKRHCSSVGLPLADLKRLLEEIQDKASMQRRRGLWQAFDEILDDNALGDLMQ